MKLYILGLFVPLSLGCSAAPAPTATTQQIQSLQQLAPHLSPQAISGALSALKRAEASGAPVRTDMLMVIDFSKPSTDRRLWVFDLAHSRVLFQELVAHGRNSGDDRAVHFSNDPNSLMSSVGAFLTGATYIGKHGLSLRLEGLDKGVNDNCLARAIVIHAADYVSEAIAKAKGRIGRSWGCPAIRPEIAKSLIQAVQGGTLMFAYAPARA